MLLALVPEALHSPQRLLTPNGLLQNASGAVASGFTDHLSAEVETSRVTESRTTLTEIIMKANVHLTVGYPSKTFHKELKVGKAITLLLMHPHREL